MRGSSWTRIGVGKDGITELISAQSLPTNFA